MKNMNNFISHIYRKEIEWRYALGCFRLFLIDKKNNNLNANQSNTDLIDLLCFKTACYAKVQYIIAYSTYIVVTGDVNWTREYGNSEALARGFYSNIIYDIP